MLKITKANVLVGARCLCNTSTAEKTISCLNFATERV